MRTTARVTGRCSHLSSHSRQPGYGALTAVRYLPAHQPLAEGFFGSKLSTFHQVRPSAVLGPSITWALVPAGMVVILAADLPGPVRTVSASVCTCTQPLMPITPVGGWGSADVASGVGVASPKPVGVGKG